jgi:PAS domain S-box-containing protein
MSDREKTKEHLLNELAEMRRRIAEFEASGTERRHTEQELLLHREQLQKLVDDRTSKLMLFSRAFEEAMDGIQIIDLNGYILYSNKAAENIYGHSADDLAGKHINELNVNVEFGETVILPSIYETGRWTGEIIVHHKDGHQFPIWLSLSMVKYENGDPAAIVGVIRDMTERKQAGDALRRSEEKFRTLFDSATDAIFILDLEGNFIDANRSAYERRGFTKEEMLTMHISQLEPPAFGAKTPERIELHKKYGHMVFESVHLRKDGTAIPVEVDSRIIDFEGKKVFFSINRDITEHKKMEEIALKTRNLESIGILAGGIAHDFNNLLSAIIGDIGIAKMSLPPGNKAIGRLENAEQICMMASELSKRLTTFATGGDPVKSNVQLSALLVDTVSAMLNGSNIVTKFDLPGDLHAVLFDEGQMKQVLNNLAINAKEAMPHGGTLTVRGENIHISAGDSSPIRAGNYVKISFSDTGVGIPSENLAKIFDPYFSTKDTYSQKGLGLGLAVCYSIIKKHDGLITVESEVGKGTSYHIYLPAAGHG